MAFGMFGGASSPTGLSRALRDNPRYLRGYQWAQAGSSTAPVGHWTQGLARLLQGGLGGWEMSKAKEEEDGKRQERSRKLAEALRVAENDPSKAMGMIAELDEDGSSAMGAVQYGVQRQDRQKDMEQQRQWRVEDRDLARADEQERRRWELSNRQGPAPNTMDLGDRIALVDRAGNIIKEIPKGVKPGTSGGPFSGNSMDAQTLNILLQGDPASPEYAAAYAHVAAPKAQLDPNTGQVVTIRPDMSPFRPPAAAQGVQGQQGAVPQQPGQPTVGRVGDPNPKPMPPEQAAKLQMVQQGLNNVQQVEQMLFGPDGKSFNRGLVASGNVPVLGGSVPGSEGAGMRALILNAVEARLRAESGAAVPEEEVKRAAERFVPNAYDSPEVARQKIQLLKEGLQGGMSLMDPQGMRPAPSYSPSPLPSAAPPPPAQPAIPQQPQAPGGEPKRVGSKEEYDALPPGTKFVAPDGSVRVKP